MNLLLFLKNRIVKITVRVLLIISFSLTILSINSQVYAQTDTVRVATYNLLNFPGSTGSERIPFFKKIILYMQPDILIVQELLSESGFMTFLNEVMNSQQTVYRAAPFHDGPDTDNGLFYNQEKIQFLNSVQIKTDLRDISEYSLKSSGIDFKIYSLHLKAGTGKSNEDRRLSETSILRNFLNSQPENTNFILVGDFNIRSSSEQAFVRLTENQSDNDGRLFDPLASPGNWHDNYSFSKIHTQSTRITSFGGGASGGLDDRFDLLLVSNSLITAGGMDILKETYNALGNDGNHINESINDRINGAVPDSVAHALLVCSDHLPVFADFVIDQVTSISSSEEISVFTLKQNYPNPFNPATTIQYSLNSPSHVSLIVYNLLGQAVATLVDEHKVPGEYQLEFPSSGLPGGIYVYQLKTRGHTETRKMILVK